MNNPLLSNDPKTQNKVFTDWGLDPNGNNELGTLFSKYAAYLHPETSKELGWLSDYAGPKMRSLIEHLVSQMNDPNELNADYQGFQQGAYENAGKEGGLLANQLRGAGYGQGASGGAIQGAYNQAAQAGNQFRSQQMSPQQRLQRLMSSLQAINGASMPGLQVQQSLFSPLEQRHEANQSEVGSGSAFTPFLNAVGSYIGGGGLGGGFGGSGQTPKTYNRPGSFMNQ